MGFIESVIYPLVALPSIFLYPIAFFTPHWVSDSRCDVVGLFYKCCTEVQSDIQNSTHNSTNITAPTTWTSIIDVTGNITSNITKNVSQFEGTRTCVHAGKDALDVRVLGLQATSTAFSLFYILYGILNCIPYIAKCTSDNVCGIIRRMISDLLDVISTEDDDGVTSSQMVSGILSFAGCMLVVKSYDRDQLGYSFYVCLVPCSIAISFIGLAIIATAFIPCYETCYADTADTVTSVSKEDNARVSDKKIVRNDGKSADVSSEDVSVEVKGEDNHVFGSDEIEEEEKKTPTNKGVANNMSDQATSNIVIQSPKSRASSGSDILDVTPGTSNEVEQGGAKSRKKKGGSGMVESLAKLNLKNLFVFKVGSCHCVFLSKKDDNMEV
ncbi:uncharacterized protein LOC123561586 [Mercenaria mercenaria]|uniref:uncharacterized protein LOC123561586 n=1 Tax=Mercenaria mercenaria TaxID=6596 RepID=UPI00234EA3ED|nr:uncharacterized protein LOC123561586 [Mercenaria mercenaria]